MSGQAAHLHESQRVRGVAGCGSSFRSSRPTCSSIVDEVGVAAGSPARAGAGQRRRAQRPEVDRSSSWGRASSRGCGSGVGRGDERRDLADHVLSKFDPDERDTIEAAVLRAADAAEMFVSEGIERVMNTFNAAADKQQEDTGDVAPAALLATYGGRFGSGGRVGPVGRVGNAQSVTHRPTGLPAHPPRHDPQGDSNDTHVRTGLRHQTRRDRATGRRPAHAGRTDCQRAWAARMRKDRSAAGLRRPPQARLRNRSSQRRHLRPRSDQGRRRRSCTSSIAA